MFVNAATILPATVKKLEAEAQQAGALLLNCPVFGRPDAAAAGSLIAVPAGAAAARQAVAPLLPAYAGAWGCCMPKQAGLQCGLAGSQHARMRRCP